MLDPEERRKVVRLLAELDAGATRPHVTGFGRTATSVAGGEAPGLPDEKGEPTGTNAPTSVADHAERSARGVERNERVEATGLSWVGIVTIMLVLLVAGFVLFLFRHR
jgi:hypothetical protein